MPGSWSRRWFSVPAIAALLIAAALALTAWQWPAAVVAPRRKPLPREDHERARAQAFLRDRRPLDSQLPAAHLLRAFRQKRLIPHIYPTVRRRVFFGSRRLAAPQPTAGNWTSLGPNPQADLGFVQVSGRVTSLAVDLADDPTGNTVYLGAAYGGIWQSTNALSADPTWTAIADNTPSLAIGAIALVPGTNPPVIIAGTGEQNNSLDSYYGVGIERGVYDATTSTWNWTVASTATNACGSACSGFPSTLPMLGLAFAKILVVPGQPNVILAAGGSSTDISAISLTAGADQYYRGIYRSTDGGQTWSLVYTQGDTNGSNYSCTDLVYDPKNSTIYAALRGHGLYQSTSAGATWAPAATPTPFVNPASVNLDDAFHRALLAVDGSGNLYTIVTDIHGELATPTPCGSGSAVCDTGIWKSPDGGKTWDPIAAPTCGNLDAKPYTSTCSPADPLFNAYNQGEYDIFIAVPPGSSTLLVGGIDVWSATPNGMNTTWSNLTQAYGPGVVHPDEHAIGFVNASTWYVGNDGGIWVTINSGDAADNGSFNAWTDINTDLATIQLYSATPDPSQAGVYTGGSQDNGTVVNTASSGTLWGQTWGGDGGNTAIDPHNPKNYFTENAYVPTPPSSVGQNPIILVSTNGGAPVNETFNSSYPACGWPGNGNITQEEQTLYNCDPTYSPILDTNLIAENGDFYLPYKLIPDDTSEMLLATCRLWMGPATPATADRGWAPISPDLTSDGAPVGFCGGDYIQDFAVSPFNTGTVYTATTDGQVQRTVGAFSPNTTWQNLTQSPLPTNGSLPFGAVAISPTGIPYLGVQGFTAGTSYGHVYVYGLQGASWTDITGNLPDTPVNAIAIDPEIPNDIYIGTDIGVFVATDGGVSGETWQQMGSGLPASAVLDLKIDNATRMLIAATHGRGAWAIPLLGTPQPGFTLTTPSSIVYMPPGAKSVPVTIGATAYGGFSGTITLTDGSGGPSTTVTPGGTATLTYSGTVPQPFTVTGTSGGVSSVIGLFAAASTFALNATPSDPTVTAGQSATITASISPQGPFTGTVSLSCPGPGDGITCAVSPASVQITSGTAATATVIITTTAAGAMPPLPPANDGPGRGWLIAALLALALLAAAWWNRLQPASRGLKPVAARRAVWLAPLLLAAMFLAMSACGSGSSAGLPPASGGGGGSSATATPTGTYSVTLQAASGSTTQTFPVILTVH